MCNSTFNFLSGVCITHYRAVLYNMVATSYIMAVEDLEFMVSATEKLNFKFYVILITLI